MVPVVLGFCCLLKLTVVATAAADGEFEGHVMMTLFCRVLSHFCGLPVPARNTLSIEHKVEAAAEAVLQQQAEAAAEAVLQQHQQQQQQ